MGRIAEKEGFKSEMKVRVGDEKLIIISSQLTAHSASEATATWRFTNFVLYYCIVLCKLYFTLDGPVRSCPLQNSLR